MLIAEAILHQLNLVKNVMDRVVWAINKAQLAFNLTNFLPTDSFDFHNF